MKTILQWFIALLILSGGLAVPSFAHTGSIRGILYDGDSHKPLEGVSLFFTPGSYSAVTDAFGKFFIRNLQPGSYAMSVTRLGFEQKNELVTIEEGVTTDMVITMHKAPVQMSSVSVNAKKDLSVSNISGIDLKLRPVNNTQDLMRLVPGLFTAQHQGGGKAEQIFLRGFDCDHGTDINVSVDNMPVNMVSHAHGQGFADAHFIIPESVQEVDYGKGPYQIDKGNLCTAGFVAFKTRNALDNSFVKAEGGMYDYMRTAMGFNLLNSGRDTNGRQDAYIMGEYCYNRSYFDLSQNFNRFNLMGKYTNYLAADKILTLTLSGFGSGWAASGQIPARAAAEGITGRFGDIDPEGGATSRYNMNLQYFQSIGSSSYFKTNIYLSYYTFRLYSDFTYFAIDSVNGDQIRQAEHRALGGYNSEYTANYSLLHLKMKTQLGLGLRYDDIMDDELSHTVNESTTLHDTLFHAQLGNVHEANVFGYASQSICLLPQLVLNFGTRYDVFVQQYENKVIADGPTTSTFTNARFSPKAALYYNISNKARIYYCYGTGFHTNDTRTLALGLQQNGPVVLQQSIPLAFSHDLGFIIKPADQLLVSAALWRLDLQQEYTYDGDVAVVSNAGPTRRYGADCSVRYEPWKWLYLDVDLNYAHGRAVDQPAGHNYIPLAPSFTSGGGATVRCKQHVLASLRYRHMSNRPANEDDTRIATGYTVFDAVINYSMPHYEFGMQVQNLFNVQWNEAQFDTETRLRYANGSLEPSTTTDVCYTPGTPFFLKVSAVYKF